MTAIKTLKVERHGWFLSIDVLDVSRRPQWEIRCAISREKDGVREQRGQRFFVTDELAGQKSLDRLAESKRVVILTQAAKRVILRQLDDIFSDPEGGLDALRPIAAADLGE
jgi:hypothetical protein